MRNQGMRMRNQWVEIGYATPDSTLIAPFLDSPVYHLQNSLFLFVYSSVHKRKCPTMKRTWRTNSSYTTLAPSCALTLDSTLHFLKCQDSMNSLCIAAICKMQDGKVLIQSYLAPCHKQQ